MSAPREAAPSSTFLTKEAVFQSFLALLVDKDGALVKEFTDEILTASLLVHAGEVRHGPTRDLLSGGKA